MSIPRTKLACKKRLNLHSTMQQCTFVASKVKNLVLQNKVLTFSKGICTAAKVLFGVIKAVSNSSAENSTLTFKRGLKTYKTQNKTYKVINHNTSKKKKPIPQQKITTFPNSHSGVYQPTPIQVFTNPFSLLTLRLCLVTKTSSLLPIQKRKKEQQNSHSRN